jgi:outer membrane protein OmpA-like peptidoglycan-associated protein
MKKFTLALGLVALLPLASQAQRYLGVATGNWSGTNNVYLNPANLGDSRHKFSIDLFSVNLGINNSLTKIQAYDAVSGFLSDDSASLGKYISPGNNDKFSILAMGEVRGPGAMVSLGAKHGIALTTRVRSMFQFHDFNSTLAKNLLDNEYSPTAGNAFKSDAFNWTQNTWAEVGLSYGGVIYEKEKHAIKGGLTLRYLKGIGYTSMTSTSLDGRYTIQNNEPILNVRNTNLKYGTAGLAIGSGIDASKVADYFTGSSTGSGVGADLGFVYEFRPKYKDHMYDMDNKTGIMDRSKPAYMLRFSAAVTDIGSINYKTGNKTLNFKNKPTVNEAQLKGSRIAATINDYNQLIKYMDSTGIAADSGTGGQSSKLQLPTMLVLGVDYNAVKNLYINLTFMGNVANHKKFGNSYYNQLTLTPRWDSRVFSVGIPITYDMLNSSMKVGAGVRIAGFFIGSDDIAGVFGSKAYGTNVYFGAYVPFNKKRPKDSDGDGISNRRDKCRNEKGVWEMQGCPNPDKDGDGVLDKDDKCPDIAGSKTAMGCPDADLDSVADAEDRCPQEAGMVALQGCPDRDRDNVADMDDACPDQAGLPQYKGCPDSDNDGIGDNEDACPNAAGPIANQGCPDTDNDGIPDNKDKCPTVKGVASNFGCPEVSVEVKKRLAFAATAVQFETGKAVIKKTSYKLLDEIVAILNNYPDYMMTIDGHTDNVGSDELNLKLSRERAASVKNYFVSKGVSTDRVVTNGYGETQPVANNKTAAGRAKNRRVAMDLKLKQ